MWYVVDWVYVVEYFWYCVVVFYCVDYVGGCCYVGCIGVVWVDECVDV